MKIKTILHKARRRIAAFSIVEATIGMGVAGTITMALFSGFTTGFFTIRMARENLRATQIMLEKTETIRLYSWDQINTPGFIPETFTASYDPQDERSQGLTYQGTLRISPAPITTSYSSEMRQVTVRLNWKTGGVNRSREFKSFISRDGLQTYIY